jgi:hypothetical protein
MGEIEEVSRVSEKEVQAVPVVSKEEATNLTGALLPGRKKAGYCRSA